jgi:hypothetical protein
MELQMRHAIAVLLAAGAWLVSFAPLAGGLLWGISLRCDDSCGGGGWRHSDNAWQWDAIAGLGVVVFIAATAMLVFVWRANRLAALLAYAVGAVAFLVLASLFSSDWYEHPDRISAGEAALYVLGFGAPLAAAVLAVRRGRV